MKVASARKRKTAFYKKRNSIFVTVLQSHTVQSPQKCALWVFKPKITQHFMYQSQMSKKCLAEHEKNRALFNPQWLSAACTNKEHRPWLVGRRSPSWRLAICKHFSGLTGSLISPWTSAHLKHLEIFVFFDIYTCLIWNISLCRTIAGLQNGKLNVPGESN